MGCRSGKPKRMAAGGIVKGGRTFAQKPPKNRKRKLGGKSGGGKRG